MIKVKNVIVLVPALFAITATVLCGFTLRKRHERKRKQRKNLELEDDAGASSFYEGCNIDCQTSLCGASGRGLVEVQALAVKGETTPQEGENMSGASTPHSNLYRGPSRGLSFSVDLLPRSTNEPSRPSPALPKCSSIFSESRGLSILCQDGPQSFNRVAEAIPMTVSKEQNSRSRNESQSSPAFGSPFFSNPSPKIPNNITAFSCLGSSTGTTVADPTSSAENTSAVFSIGSTSKDRFGQRFGRNGRRGGSRNEKGRRMRARGAERKVEAVSATTVDREIGAEGGRGGKKSRR